MPAAPISHLVSLHRLSDALSWCLQLWPQDRARWVIDQLSLQVARGASDRILLCVTEPASNTTAAAQPLGVAVAIVLPGRAATLLASRGLTSDHLLQTLVPLQAELRRRGVRFLQVSVQDCPGGNDRSLLLSAGFVAIAHMELMLRPLVTLPPTATLDPPLPTLPPRLDRGRWFTLADLADAGRQQLEPLLQATFVETQDCPALTELRAAEDITAGYLDDTDLPPTSIFLLQVDNCWAGCLLMKLHDRSAADGRSAELAYMGLVPAFRGRRLGHRLLTQAIQLAKSHSCERVVLAVDQNNRAAKRCYEFWGWRAVDSEVILGRQI